MNTVANMVDPRAGTNTEWFEVEANNTSTNANRIGVPSEPNTWCRILNVYQKFFIPGVVLCRFRIMSGRSVVWNFCRESESNKKKWKCEVCCETARNANTTTNLLNHLKRQWKTPRQVQIDQKLKLSPRINMPVIDVNIS